jgi:hypothetical protein
LAHRVVVAPVVADPALPADHFIVYLSGIGDVSATFLHALELGYVSAIEAALP